jgi:hypothetical protein
LKLAFQVCRKQSSVLAAKLLKMFPDTLRRALALQIISNQRENKLFERVCMLRLQNGVIVVTDSLNYNKYILFALLFEKLAQFLDRLRQSIDKLEILSPCLFL